MTMHKMIAAVMAWVVLGVAWAAEPVKTQTKTSTPSVKTKSLAKPAYVKAAPVVAAPMVPSPVADVKVQEEVAGNVHTGHMVCELGNSVSVNPDPQQPARFIVQMKKNIYHMSPVETTTGAVRLEDAQAGAMWLQLPHKSMLMNSKVGQRMADECQSEHQTAVAHRMKLDPPPSLLDAPALAKK
jgi:hypothetical protein